MRIKRQDGTRRAAPPGFIARNIDQPAVAAVHAVEVANRYNGAPQPLGHGLVGAADCEGGRVDAWPS
jgi:hypothetical protein